MLKCDSKIRQRYFRTCENASLTQIKPIIVSIGFESGVSSALQLWFRLLPASLLRLRGFTAPLLRFRGFTAPFRFAWLVSFGLPFATSLWHNLPPIAEIGIWVRL